jgi:hypothetical protein
MSASAYQHLHHSPSGGVVDVGPRAATQRRPPTAPAEPESSCVCTRSGSETRGHWTSRGRRERVTLLAGTSQKLSDHFDRPSSILWPATYCMAGGTVRLGYLRQMQAPNHHGLRLLPLDVQSPPTKHRFAPARPHPVQRVGPLTCTALLLSGSIAFSASLYDNLHQQKPDVCLSLHGRHAYGWCCCQPSTHRGPPDRLCLRTLDCNQRP